MDKARRKLYATGELDYAVSPGETLRECLEEQGMNRHELVAHLGVPPAHVDELIGSGTGLRRTISRLGSVYPPTLDGNMRMTCGDAAEPADDVWYRTSGWQPAEAEADADIREGRTRAFDTMDELFAEIDKVRGEPFMAVESEEGLRRKNGNGQGWDQAMRGRR